MDVMTVSLSRHGVTVLDFVMVITVHAAAPERVRRPQAQGGFCPTGRRPGRTRASEPLALFLATSAVGQPASPGPSGNLDFLSRESTYSLRIVDPERKIHLIGAPRRNLPAEMDAPGPARVPVSWVVRALQPFAHGLLPSPETERRLLPCALGPLVQWAGTCLVPSGSVLVSIRTNQSELF